MSGSYDRPTGPPTLQPTRPRLEHDPYGGPSTGPPTLSTARPRLAHAPKETGQAEPRSRSRRTEAAPASAPIVPAGSVTGRSLTLVITIMCFLACLTAGAVYMMNQSASAWLRDIASEVTVQIEAKERTDLDKAVADVTAFLSRQPGIATVRALGVADAAQLLEPWLGKTDALSALPVPRLIAIELDRNQPPDLDALRTLVAEQFKGATLDDHRRWQQQIRTITRSFALGGLAILILVGAATTAIIVSATRSAMASNRDIVEVLHFVGATDRFIAREFERHFLRLGVGAGIVGAIWAMVVFLIMPTVMGCWGGAVTIAEIRRLIGIAALDPPGYFLLGIVVLVIASLCMLTSRIGVYRILNSQH
jgi:cell division transport system permease protein